MKNLFITKEGIRRYIDANDNAMYSLFDGITEVWEDVIKEEVKLDLAANNKVVYTFVTAAIELTDSEFFTLYNKLEDDLSYRLKIKQDEFWKAVDTYRKLENQAYKKMTISFDGEKVYFDLEK